MKVQLGGGGACLYSQDLGGRGSQSPMSSRPTWFTKQVPGQPGCYTEKPNLEKPNENKTTNKLQTTTNLNNLGYYAVVSQIEKDIKEVKGIIYF